MVSLSKACTRHRSLALLLLGLLALQLDLGRAAEEDAMDGHDEAEEEEDDEDELGEEQEEGEDEDDDITHPLSNLPPSSSAVYAGVLMVSHSGAEIQLGDPVEVICGFRNTGAEALNITHMLGSLNNPENFFEYVDNFTEIAVNRESDPKSELSLDYRYGRLRWSVGLGWVGVRDC
jgi:hypothetical protein